MLKTFFLISLCCALVTTQAQNNKADARLTGLDTALIKLLKDWHGAGFAVAIVEKNKIIYSKGFGYRDIEQKKPVTPNTLFAIGSCTKAFTASLLGILAKDGKVSLDNKLTEYLPALHFYNDAMDNSITIRDVMSHRSGLPRHDLSWYFFNSSSHDSLMRRLKYLEPSAAVREKWQYNNFGFLLQGMIAEKLTGQSWELNIRERFFTKLEMTHSNLSVKDLPMDADASLGYGVMADSIIKKIDYYNIDGMGPAGSINSSVTEMANWVITWINGGKFKGKEIIPSSYVREAISSQMIVPSGPPDMRNPDIYFYNNGLGWFLSSYRGHYQVEHGGNIDGFSASTCFYPSDSIGIIVLSNQNNSLIPSLARNLVADRMLKLKYINWSGNRKTEYAKAKMDERTMNNATTSSQISNTKTSHSLSAYEGNYSNPGYGTIYINLKGDSLIAKIGKDPYWLRHYHYDIFEMKGYDGADGLDTSKGGLKINFRTGETGGIEMLTAAFETLAKPIEFLYTPNTSTTSTTAADLEKYAGDYSLGTIKIKISVREGILYMLVPDQPEYETIPVGNDSFKMKLLNGYSIQFESNDKNEVTGMIAIQPNGRFKATKIK